MEENVFHVSFTVELFIRQIDRKLLAAMSVSDVTLIDVWASSLHSFEKL